MYARACYGAITGIWGIIVGKFKHYKLEQKHIFTLKSPIIGNRDGFTLEKIYGDMGQEKFGHVQGHLNLSWKDTLS